MGHGTEDLDTRETAVRRVLAGAGGLPVGHEKGVRPEAVSVMAEALAVLVVDLVAILPAVDRTASLERLANRLDDRGRTPNGTPAARLLGEVGSALLRIGC